MYMETYESSKISKLKLWKPTVHACGRSRAAESRVEVARAGRAELFKYSKHHSPVAEFSSQNIIYIYI